MQSSADRQKQAEAAVVIGTVLRPTLLRAVRSVFRQDLAGRIHVLIGIDQAAGDTAQLETLRNECPRHVTLTILDPGYSTAQRHGGVYPSIFGGALKTVLSYLGNSRYVTYLDDDDWWARDHLSSLRAAISGRSWAYSYRWLVDRDTEWPICRDEWDSVGVGQGINQQRFGGFACPSTMMLDKEACHFLLPFWSLAQFPDGIGDDRLVFRELLKQPSYAATGRYSCFYELRSDVQKHPHHAREFAARRIGWMGDRDRIDRIARLTAEAATALQNGNLAAAAGACRQVLEINPHHAPALQCLAQVEWRSGRLAEALRHITHGLEVADHDASILSLAETLTRVRESLSSRP